jgi:hypothetical protein
MTVRQIEIAVVLLFLVGCSAPAATPAPPTPVPVPPTSTAVPPTPTPVPPTPTLPVSSASAEKLIGAWQPLSKSVDAMFLQSSSLDGLTAAPEVECTYTFEGADLSMTAVKLHGVPACPSPTGRYAVQLVADNQIELVATQDSCGPRKGSTVGVYQRVP